MNILIDNCVPLNNGDAALIFSIGDLLENDNTVTYNSNNSDTALEIYPEKKWTTSLLGSKLNRGVWKLFPVINKFIYFFPVVFGKKYRKSDVIISAPGGYIHSYYGIEFRLYILYICKVFLKKKVGIYSQSIGELSPRDKKIFKKYASRLDFVFVRDQVSLDRAINYGLKENLYLTKDAAFLLRKENIQIHKKSRGKKIAISVRAWDKEGRSQKNYIELIKSIVDICLSNEMDIEFISTCQGIDSYVDDSILAREIVKTFGWENNEKISVDSTYNTLDELQTKIREFDFVIGTRLHMCILSLINDVPAFNISYEEKGRETYKYLEIEDFSIDYNDLENLDVKLKSFLNIDENRLNVLKDTVNGVVNEQKKYFFKMTEIIKKDC